MEEKSRKFTNSEFIWNIDFEESDPKKTGKYRISGWVLSKKGGQVQLKACLENQEDSRNLEYTVERKAREDVQAAFPGMPKNSDAGFFCLLELSEEVSNDCLVRLYAVQADVQECILERSSGEIRQAPSETLEYQVDNIRPCGEDVVISGWCVDPCQEYTLTAYDADHNKLESNFTRSVRADVQMAKGLSREQACCGFNLVLPRSSIKTPTLHLFFANHLTKLEYIVDMKEYDKKYSSFVQYRKLLGLSHVKENIRTFRKEGVSKFVYGLRMEVEPEKTEYPCWLKAHQITEQTRKMQSRWKFKWNPKISILIPLYNTDLHFLKVLLDSIQKQSYGNWELCLADASDQMQVGNYIRRYYGKDTRILYRKLKDNKGISANTNAALKMASGEYVLLSDHDDVLEPNALYEIVKALNKRPELDIVYTDEDKVSFDGKQYFDPHFKPDFNIGMLRSNNYICHITVIRKNIMKKIGGFRPEFDGAQDFDLILRCAEQTRQIGHIPKILYHWRCHPGSTAANPKSKMYAYDAGRKALEEHYKRCGIAATVENTQLLGYYRTRFIRKEDPMISIIIPNKDHIEDLQKCLNSIREVSTYTNYEILIVENNSEDPETFRYYEALQKEWKQVRVLYWKDIFNYASINNFGVEESKGEYLLFLNNDVEVITPDWLEEMLGFAMQKDIGAVGAKLYFPNYTIQHAGVVIGLGGVAGHIAVGMPGTDYGYHGRSVIAQDYSAVTAACMMVRKEVFLEVQGFDPAFQVAYNDIDLCMKIRSHGYRVAFTPFAELYHYESKSRGSEDSPEKKARFQREVALFEQKWPEILKHGDPCYNKNLTLTNVDCSLRESYDDYTKKRKHHKSR